MIELVELVKKLQQGYYYQDSNRKLYLKRNRVFYSINHITRYLRIDSNRFEYLFKRVLKNKLYTDIETIIGGLKNDY